MAAVFGNLTVLRRRKELFYCFREARSKLFSNIGEDYLNNAVRYLGIEIVMSNVEETAIVQKFLPSQIGPFGLISEQNLLRLQAMLLNSRRVESQMPNFEYQFPFGANNVATSFLPADFRFVSWPFEGRFGRGNSILLRLATSTKINANGAKRLQIRRLMKAQTVNTLPL